MANFHRVRFAQWLVLVGTSVLGLGVFLLLVKVVMFIAWHTAGAVALTGLGLLAVGAVLRRL